MGTLNDEIRRATGGGAVNDGLRSWFSAVSTESLEDAERRWLLAFPATSTGTNEDLWMQYLGSLAYTGALNDRLLQYWTAQP